MPATAAGDFGRERCISGSYMPIGDVCVMPATAAGDFGRVRCVSDGNTTFGDA